MSNITLENGTLVVSTPYNQALVSEIKALPFTDRRWDAGRKAWLVNPTHGQKLVTWLAQYLNEMILLPQMTAKKTTPELKLLDVRYIGATKERAVGQWAAFGFCQGNWSVLFPEATLRQWFDAAPPSAEQSYTLYGLLSISGAASADEIKAGFRRMARQWHPDVCKEPNAAEMFCKIKDAYDLLNDPGKRARYDAGLRLEATVNATVKIDQPVQLGYRSPLRCGMILCEGVPNIGRFEVSRVLQWEDITDDAGRTLVVSWSIGAKTFVESWV